MRIRERGSDAVVNSTEHRRLFAAATCYIVA
jgi:hypothetical protein